jgi:geranylgeranyl reductase family protein
MATSDVIVVGGGPAGAIASLVCARAALSVVLLEKSRRPRDKVCGEALIPDALDLLRRLDIHSEVAASAWPVEGLRVYSPNGSHVDIRGECLTIRRRELDATLLDIAERDGVRVIDGAEATGFKAGPHGAAVTADRSGEPLELRSRIVILATGASAKALGVFSVPHRKAPSAMGVRTYFRTPAGRPQDMLRIWFEKPVLPFYGWIFPLGGDIFNAGVGAVFSTGRDRPNLRELFVRFTKECRQARALLDGCEQLSPLKGAPLRTALTGARPSAERLLVTGEAAGTTYPLTGEGIGKAMETAALAAEVAIEAIASGRLAEDYLRRYDDLLERRFRRVFRQYEAAQRWLRYPFIADLLARKARRHHAVRVLLEDMLAERCYPTELLSAWGILKLLLRT